jgi:DNA-binding CsgD family transcriptional regulator
LLILVDDAHWLDSASSACLAYLSRRLAGSPVAVIAAIRTGEDETVLSEASIPTLELAGLGREDAEALLRERTRDLGGRAVAALCEVTLGNPLALIELPRTLSAEQRLGQAPLDPVPAPGGAIGAAFERKLSLLDPQSRSALLVAAAAFDRTPTAIVAAARELGLSDAALERCEDAGLLEITPGRMSFSHPLLRSVTYAASSAKDRRKAHRALAGHSDDDSRAWHLAAAALGPDAEAAGALEGAAFRATMRGAHLTAADALERAAQLSEPDTRGPRLFTAGLAAALGGSFDRAAGLLEAASDGDDPNLKATARHLLAMVRLTGGIGSALDNHDLLLAEAEERLGEDRAGAAALFADAGVAAVIGAEAELALAAAERAVAVLPAEAPPTVRCQAHAIHGMALMLSARADDARLAFDRAGELLPQVELLSSAPQSIALSLGGRVSTGQVGVLRDEAHFLAAKARENRSLGILPYLQQLGADASYRLGDWDDAERESEEAALQAEASGQLGPEAIALAGRARTLAARGKTEEARAAAARAIALAERPGKAAAAMWARAAVGFLELAIGRGEEAITELERVRDLAAEASLEDPLIIPWAPDLVEAYARAGRTAEARAAAEALSHQAERNGTPLALALAARSRAIAESDADGFERAIELHARSEQPFELGRTLLAYGSRLHRARRRTEARERLREALEIFEGLGATPWVQQARIELRAAGGVERRPAADPNELTAQELRVARAVAAGATNKEVAAELFLSPKTIEFHLGRVYRKLEINSRTQLATLVAEGSLEANAETEERDGLRAR